MVEIDTMGAMNARALQAAATRDVFLTVGAALEAMCFMTAVGSLSLAWTPRLFLGTSSDTAAKSASADMSTGLLLEYKKKTMCKYLDCTSSRMHALVHVQESGACTRQRRTRKCVEVSRIATRRS